MKYLTNKLTEIFNNKIKINFSFNYNYIIHDKIYFKNSFI